MSDAETQASSGERFQLVNPGPPDDRVGAPVVVPKRLGRLGILTLVVVVSAWVVTLVLMLLRPVFISHDSLSNNVHVWWISEQIWGGGDLPMHIGVLANGEALTFPYASIPWLSAAVAWPLLGDRAVSLWLVIGLVATIGATFWTFPSLRKGWWAVAVLTNPALVISPLLGQLPFLWSIALFTFAMGMWRRGRVAAAVVLTSAAQIIHPAVTLPIAAVIVALWLLFEQPSRRRPLIGWWMLTVLISLPAVWAVFQSPVVTETTLPVQVVALLQTVAVRLLVVLVPMILVGVQYQKRVRVSPWIPALLSVIFVALQIPMYEPFGMDFAWGSLRRNAPPTVDAFAESQYLISGDTYRVLSGFDGKYGLYAVVRNGGVLDAEFFPEGLHRGGFASLSEYSVFLRTHRVDHAVVFPTYARKYRRSNETKILDRMVVAGCVDGVRVTRGPSEADWKLYDVQVGC